MKKQLLLALGVSALVLFTGCANKTQVQQEEDQKEEMIETVKNLPDWVLKPEVKDSISSVGMTNYSRHGLHAMLTLAEMDGRAKLAGKIQTTISQLQEKSMRQLKIENIDDFETIFSQVTKEVIKDIALSGTQRMNLHQAKDGSLYVLMAIDNKNILKTLQESKEVYTQHMKNAKVAKENLDKGMEVLDDMLDRLEEAKAQ